MSKKLEDATSTRGYGATLTTRLEIIRNLNERNSSHLRTIPSRPVAEALIAPGYTSLDEQAKALGLNRSTTWTIVKNKHKLGYLNSKTTQRILANPTTPQSVRSIIQQYLAQPFDALHESVE